MASTNPFLLSPFQTLIQQEEAKPLPGAEQVKEAQPLPDLSADTDPATAATPAPQPSTSATLAPPKELRDVFAITAAHFNVPENVLMALAQQESSYRADASNKDTGASGMMQYMDATAKSLGINASDPNEAVPAAAQQLRQRLDKGMSLEDAIKEHFAGPDRKKWGEKTTAYGKQVLAKAEQIGAELYGDAADATPADAPSAPDTQQNQFAPTRMGKADYEAEFRKLNPRASDAAVKAALAQYDQQAAAKTKAAGNRVQDKFKALQSPDAMFNERLNARLQEDNQGIVQVQPGHEQQDFSSTGTRHRPGVVDQARGDFGRGIDQLKALGYGAGGLAADASGYDAKADELLGKYVAIQNDIAKNNPATIGTYKNVHDLGDAGRYAIEAVMENLPMILPSLVTGGAGAKLAQAGAQRVVGGMIEAQVAKGIAREVAEKNAAQFITRRIMLGSAAGATPATIGMESGSIMGDIYQDTGKKASGTAIAFGIPAGLLDTLEPVLALRKIAGPAVDEVAGGIIKRLGVEAGKQFITEAGTEGLQTILEEAAKSTASGKKLMTPALLDNVIDSMLKGGIGGVGMGMASQGVAEARASVAGRPLGAGPAPAALQDTQQNQAVAEADARPAAPATSTPSGPLSAAIEAATPPAFQADDNGFTGQILGDDGQVHTIDSRTGVTMAEPPAAPAGPLEAAIKDAAEQHAINPAPLPKQPQEAPQPPALETLPLEDLRTQLKQVAAAAQANPAQRQDLMKQRQAIEKEIGARAKQAKADSKPAEEPLTTGPFEDIKAANKMMLRHAEAMGVPYQVVGSDGKFEVKPIGEQGDGINPAGAARGPDGHGRSGEPADAVGRADAAGSGEAGPGAGGSRGSGGSRPVASELPDAGADRAGADGAANAQPALKGAHDAVSKTRKNDAHGAAGVPDAQPGTAVAAGKQGADVAVPAVDAKAAAPALTEAAPYHKVNPFHAYAFPDEARANAFMDKKAVDRDQFEAVQTGPVRWQVKPRAAPVQDSFAKEVTADVPESPQVPEEAQAARSAETAQPLDTAAAAGAETGAGAAPAAPDIKVEEKHPDGISSALKKLIESEQATADEWANRVYKKNKTQVELHGDGPSNNASMSISGINELRRRNAIDAAASTMAVAKKLHQQVSSPEGQKSFMRDALALREKVGSDAEFEAAFLDQLKVRPPGGKGSVTSNSLSRTVLAEVKREAAKQANQAKTEAIDPAEVERARKEVRARLDAGDDPFAILFGDDFYKPQPAAVTSPAPTQVESEAVNTPAKPKRKKAAPKVAEPVAGQDEGVRHSVSGDQTESPAFKAWFGASKVVDKDGKPLVVYHGTNADVSELKSKGELHPGLPWTRGIYFTADPEYASRYAEGDGANVMPVYLRMENPKIVTDSGFKTASISQEQIDQLRAEGHDGIINHADDEYIVFDSKQVKSATGNSGAFDPASPDIRYSTSSKFSEDNRLSNLSPSGASWERIRAANPELANVRSMDDEVTVYRATIGDTIRPDDYVALNRKTLAAELRNVRARDKGAKIITAKVRVRDLLMANDATEFVYYPDSPKFSAAHPLAAESAREISPLVQSLADKGAIILHADASTLPVKGKAPSGTQALTTADGTIHVVANALGDNARGIILHEAFHAGTKALIGSAAWDGLNTRLGALYRQGEKSSGAARVFWDAARARVETAKAKGAVSSGMEHEEFGAYAIEEYAKAPLTVRKWVDDLIGAVKAWALRRFGKQLGNVTPAQLSSLAKLALLDAQVARSADLQLQPAFSAVDQATTPAFKKWFDGSKIVNPDGAPLVVYHGTANEFNEFQSGPGFRHGHGKQMPAMYFSPIRSTAEAYARTAVNAKDASSDGPGHVVAAYLSIKNPAIFHDVDDFAKAKRDKLESAGHDGAIRMNSFGEPVEIAAFRPEQVKSATDNNGNFDPKNPDIRYAADSSKTIEVDGQRRPIENSRGKLIAPDMHQQMNFWRWAGDTKVVDEQGRPRVVYHGTTVDVDGVFKSGTNPHNDGIFFTSSPRIAGLVYANGDGSISTDSALRKLNEMGFGKIDPTSEDFDAAWALAKKIREKDRHFDWDAEDLGSWLPESQRETISQQLVKAIENTFQSGDIAGVEAVESVLGVRMLGATEGGNVMPVYLSMKNPKMVDGSGLSFDDGHQADWIAEARAAGNDGLIIRNYDDGGTGRVDNYQSAGRHNVYIAFKPEQVKSVTGNSGEFSESSPDIRYSVAGAPQPRVLTPDEQGLLRRVQAGVQDGMNRVKQVQQRISEITGVKDLAGADYYGAETNRPGRIAARKEDGRDKLIEPMMRRLAKAGYTQEQLSELLHAQHAEERNEAVARINPEFPDGGSGMKTAEAHQIMARYQGEPALLALADEARQIARETLDMKRAYGLITDAQYDDLATAYDNYVPLKGDGEYGPKVKRAMGHGEREEHVVENIARDFEQAIVVGEKNLARQSLLQMVLQYPDDGLWTARVPPKGRYVAGTVFEISPVGTRNVEASFTSQSQVAAWLEGKGAAAAGYEVNTSGGERVTEFTKPLQDNEVMVYVKGSPVRVQVHDEVLARQLRPLHTEMMNTVLGFMQKHNRYLSTIYTGYNPAFILKNATRDAITGSINMTGNHGALTAAKAWAKYPAAWATMLKWAMTKEIPTGTMGDHLREYRAQGGKIGASYMSDLEEQGKTLQRMFDDAKGVSGYAADGKIGKAAWIASRKAIGGMAHAVEVLNQAFENSLRLALFAQLREQGAKPGQAAQAAKTVTVNFDRKGTATPYLGAFYLFINPAIQGTANLTTTLAKGEHKGQAWALAGMMAAAGFAAAIHGMDDDKDRWLGEKWDTRTKNLHIRVGSHTINVPLSQEYAPFYAVGVAMGEVRRGQSSLRASANVLSSFLDAYYPMQGAIQPGSDNYGMDLLLAHVPTVGKMAAQIAANRNSFGNKVVPETDNTKNRPDNLKMYRGTKTSAYDASAQGIAAAGQALGADKYGNDLSKVSPETLKLIWSTYTGGLGKFVADSAGLGTMLAQGPGQIEVGDVPVVKDFVKADKMLPLRTRYFDLAKDAQDAIDQFAQAKKMHDAAEMKAIATDPEKGPVLGLAKMVAAVNKIEAVYADMAVNINADKTLGPAGKRARLKDLEDKQEVIYRKAIKAFKN